MTTKIEITDKLVDDLHSELARRGMIYGDKHHSQCHRRSTDRQGPDAISYGHRRKDDPK